MVRGAVVATISSVDVNGQVTTTVTCAGASPVVLNDACSTQASSAGDSTARNMVCRQGEFQSHHCHATNQHGGGRLAFGLETAHNLPT